MQAKHNSTHTQCPLCNNEKFRFRLTPAFCCPMSMPMHDMLASLLCAAETRRQQSQYYSGLSVARDQASARVSIGQMSGYIKECQPWPTASMPTCANMESRAPCTCAIRPWRCGLKHPPFCLRKQPKTTAAWRRRRATAPRAISLLAYSPNTANPQTFFHINRL